jgi:hypothetical protein
MGWPRLLLSHLYTTKAFCRVVYNTEEFNKAGPGKQFQCLAFEQRQM